MAVTEPTDEVLVAVFADRAPLEAAIDDLQTHGLDRSQLSLLTGTPAQVAGSAAGTADAPEGNPQVDADSPTCRLW